MNKYPRLVVAGVRGGSGKTMLSLGIIAALRNRKGLSVVPFKKGPDYIDAGWMSVAAGNPCYNLDPFLIKKEKIMDSFLSHFTGDIAIIEGNRGLYDGMDVEGSYSTAELAKLLKAPVVLIIDCTKMTRTAAAIVLGCLNMDKEVGIKGVVLNQLSGSRHESVIRASVERYCALPVVGAIPRLPSGDLPERHMGLTPYQEHEDIGRAIEQATDMAMKYLDMDRILDIAKTADPLEKDQVQLEQQKSPTEGELKSPTVVEAEGIEKTVRIGIIRDSAFQFYYPENLEELERNGAEIVEINAMEEDGLPDLDALYIGGGFPETNAIRLAENTSFRHSVHKAVEKGLPVYAECGGLMFLGDAIVLESGSYPMVGIFPLNFEMKKKPQAHGYTVVEVERQNPFYPVGTILHGHEFHYSAVIGMSDKKGVYTALKVKRGNGIKDKTDGICYKNVFAAYTHVHALGVEEWAIGLIKKAREFKVKND